MSSVHPERSRGAAAILILGFLAAFANVAELGSLPPMTMDGPLTWGWAGPHRMDCSVAISLLVATTSTLTAVRLPTLRWPLAAVSALHLCAAAYVWWAMGLVRD
ncbi:MAG: hypothetical protein Q8L48_11830 [Archangium sp.]|nr:hypothetical protein [Archangium sp.]